MALNPFWIEIQSQNKGEIKTETKMKGKEETLQRGGRLAFIHRNEPDQFQRGPVSVKVFEMLA